MMRVPFHSRFRKVLGLELRFEYGSHSMRLFRVRNNEISFS